MRKFITPKLFTAFFILIVLAGCTGSETVPTQPGTYFNDLWSYDLVNDQWAPVSPADLTNFPPPSQRRDHTAVVDPDTGVMYVFGGFNGTDLGDLWSYAPGTNNWTLIPPATGDTPPSGRRGHSAVWYSGKMYIFGGFNGVLLNDLWVYDPAATTTDQWMQISPAADAQQPPYRRYHSAIVYSSEMYIFGGDNGAYQNELWVYDFVSKSWKQEAPIGDLPARRNGHSAVEDGSGKMYIFGGWTTGSKRLNDVWECNLMDFTWQDKTPTMGAMPTARGVHSAVMLSGQMVVFGGYDTEALDELWKYTIATTWSAPTTGGPSARYAHSAVVNGTSMYIFGGYGPPTQ